MVRLSGDLTTSIENNVATAGSKIDSIKLFRKSVECKMEYFHFYFETIFDFNKRNEYD